MLLYKLQICSLSNRKLRVAEQIALTEDQVRSYALPEFPSELAGRSDLKFTIGVAVH